MKALCPSLSIIVESGNDQSPVEAKRTRVKEKKKRMR